MGSLAAILKEYDRKSCCELLLHALTEISEKIPHSDLGICGNVCRWIESHYPDPNLSSMCLSVMKSQWVHWELFSGSRDYPIPGDDHGPISAESRFYRSCDLWMGTYGDKRWALLEWLIAEQKKELGLFLNNTDTTHCVAPIYSD